ncbi:MAG: porin family protein, partial [Acidiferrobacterales bacterium]|nr:porin family protein [Acidiferrobacterales bacterium]
AAFAFERILLLYPENDRVRLELARAHFMLGNLLEARTQFEIVLTHNPPPNVRERVKLFLAKIKEQEKALRSVFHGYVVTRLGYDSNVNSGPASQLVPGVPGVGTVILAPAAVELSGNFLEVELAGEALRPISKKKALFGKVTAIVRDNFNVEDNFDDEFDTARLLLRGGISFLGKRSVLRLPIEYENIWLNSADPADFRRSLLAGIEWERSLNAANRIMPFGQLGAVRYGVDPIFFRAEQGFRDVNLALIGGTWIHRFARANKEFRLGIYYGDEDNVEDNENAEAIARTYVGLFGLFQWNPTPRQLFFLNATVQASDYDGEQPVFGEVREDDYYTLTLGWNWRWRPKWTINVELKYENQESNLDIFSYDRTQVFGGVRFDFR